jgi:hypothetical protein
MQLSTIALATSILTMGAACKTQADDRPEYEVQQNKGREARKAVEKAVRVAQRRGPDAGYPQLVAGIDDRDWPPSVREAFKLLHSSSFDLVPRNSKRLAQLGIKAAPAMRYLIGNYRQPQNKRATLSLLLAQVYMFQPAELAKMAREPLYPILQRAAIERLAQLGTPESRRLLSAVAEAEKPMAPFIAQAQSQRAWGLTEAQVRLLDQIMHAESTDAATEMLRKVDLRYQAPLLEIIASPVAKPPIVGLCVRRLVDLRRDAPAELKEYCRARYPAVLRLIAARELLLLGTEHRPFVDSLTKDLRDPLAGSFRRLLQEKP